MFLSLFTNKNKGPEFHRTPFFSSWDFQSVRPESGVIVSTKSTPKSGVIDLQYHQSHVQFEFPLANSNIKQIAADKISFVSPQKNIEPQYQTLENGIKENIILHQIPSTNQFPVTLRKTNADLYLTTENLPIFLDPQTHQELFQVQKPFAYDAKGNKTYGVYFQLFVNNQPVPNPATTTPDTYHLLGPLTKIKSQPSYQLVLKVDSKWLFDKSRTYPITIDPTIISPPAAVQTQTQFSQGSLNRIKDTGATDPNPNLETYYQEVANDQNTVGLWHFNEGTNLPSGSTLADVSGLGNTAMSMTSYISNIFGDTTTPMLGKAAVNIGDTANYLIVGDNDSLSFTNGKFTIETWFKSGHPAATAVDHHFLVAKAQNSNYEYGLYINSTGGLGGELYTSVGGNCGTVGTTGDFGDNQWHHAAFTADGGNINIYVDGTLLSTSTQLCNPTNTSADLIFGRRSDSLANYSWSGELDEARLSNVARSAEQIRADAQRRPYGVYTSTVFDLLGGTGGTVKQWNLLSWTGPGMATGDGETLANTTGLIAQWNFNETAGTTAAVSAGSCGVGCSGALTNFASTGSQDASPGTGWTFANRRWGSGALMFNGATGAGNYVVVPNNASLNVTSAISIETWINFRYISGDWTNFILKDDETVENAPYSMSAHNFGGDPRVTFGVTNSSNTTASSGYWPITLNQWHHLVGTYDGSYVKFYMDGRFLKQSSLTGSLLTNTKDLWIGKWRNAYDEHFSGAIDSTRIYSRALTASEILSNYNAANIEFQTRTSSDGINWEAWKGGVGDSQIDSADNTNDYWGVDTSPNADSTTAKTSNINTGSGADGPCSIASGSTNLNSSSCASRGTADAINTTSTVLTGVGDTGITITSTTGLSTGNEILIINLQGTATNYDSVGKYEIHTIAGFNGSTPYFTDYPIKYTYDGTTQKIMVQRVPNYTNVTIGTGATMTVNAWNGSTGGVLFFKATGTVTNNGSISTDSTGYRGSIHYTAGADNSWGYIGESEGAAYSTTRQQSGIASGGGGGSGQAGGGGGGYNSPGFSGASSGCTSGPGLGGNNTGNTPLEAGLRFGGSGGSSGSHTAAGRNGASGGSSGGVISILANSINSPGIISSVGTTGENGYKASGTAQPVGGGGGGAGGAIQIKANTVSITGSLNIFGGDGGGSNASDACSPSGRGGNGGTGRISIFYSNSYTNSVSLNTTNAGTGIDGTCTPHGTVNLNAASCSGRATFDAIMTNSAYLTSAGSNSINVTSSAGFAPGDEALIINLQGTAAVYDTAGRYETVIISRIVSNTLYFNNSLVNSYDGTTQKIMVQRVPNYTNVNVNAGSALTATAWNGTIGGVVFFRVKGILNNAGTIQATGLGYRGGGPYNTYSTGGNGTQGESYHGLGTASNASNGGGGGGGNCPSAVNCWSQGGGGASGSNGITGGTLNGTGGVGGIAYASQSNERLNLGSGGGGGADVWSGYPTNGDASGTVGTGGNGGGIIFVSAANINNTGTFLNNGTDGGPGVRGPNGGGGGGGGDLIINNLNSFGTLTSSGGGGGGVGGSGPNITSVVNPPPAASVKQTGSLIKQEGTNSIRFDAGIPQVDSATIGLWHLDETDKIQSPAAYYFTGDTQTYTVPSGVTSIVVKSWGGGGGGGSPVTSTYGFPGGGGGYATGTISVTPGQVLQLIVGAGGTAGSSGTSSSSFGGGAGCLNNTNKSGGQGGGRSAIRIGGVNGTEILTAGGGGGGGVTTTITNDMTGGGGGGTTGQAGYSYLVSYGGGRGGTQATGGLGGVGAGATGVSGSQFQGGTPGSFCYGGGGGGGYYGGGGGGYTAASYMAGGGAGSSYVNGTGVSGGSTSSATGSVPGNSTDPYISGGWVYDNKTGTGGIASANGTPGKIVIFPKDANGNIINTITDSSEYHQTSTIIGTTPINGVVNKGRSFASGQFQINDSPSLNPTKITMEGWLKTQLDGSLMILKWDSLSRGYGLGVGTSKAACYVGGGSWVYGTTTITDNKWHYTACTYDGINARIYVDGKLEGTLAQSGNLSSKASLFIGNGNISLDEIRLSNIARSPEEIMESYRLGANRRLSRSLTPMNLSQNSKLPFKVASNRLGSNLELTIGNNPFVNYEPDANTVGLWHLDDPDVGTTSAPTNFIKDATGNGNNGTPGVGTSYPLSATGKIGLARSFNGINHYISVNDIDSLSFTNRTFSLSAWINTSKNYTGSYGTIVAKGIGTSWEYALWINSTNNPQFILWPADGGSADLINGTSVINDGRWHHIVGTADNSNLKIYVDGNIQGTVPITKTASNGNSPLNIGRRPDNNFFFSGSLDEVRVDNVARSAADIRAAYDYGFRTHQVVIDFKAKPDASGIGVTATSFNLDETSFGTTSKLPHLFFDDELIVQENIGGTEYLAQGLVSTADPTTGAVTMNSWDIGSSFPFNGFTTNATVFKWQQEFFDLKGSIPEQRNNISRLTMRVTNGTGGGSYWLDDFQTVTNMMNISLGSTIKSSYNRYFQYRAIESTSDSKVSASLQGTSLDYLRNYAPAIPSLISPTSPTYNLQATISLGTSSVDQEVNNLQYKIQICTTPIVNDVGCTTYDQTSSQVGWSGQDADGGTTYKSGNITIPTPSTKATLTVTLPYNNTYYWRSWAIDPSGSNVWSATQTTASIFATSYSPIVPSLLYPSNHAINQKYVLNLGTSTTDPNNDPVMYQITLCTDAGMTTNCHVFDQTADNLQVGWSGQDTSIGSTSAYNSTTTASYTLQYILDPSTTYYWKSRAIDPSGSHLWGPTQTTPNDFRTANIPLPPTNCLIEEAPDDSYLKLKWDNHAVVLDGFVVQRNVDGVGYSQVTSIADPNAVNFSDTNILENHIYQYRVAAYIIGPYYSGWCESPKLNLGGVLPTPTIIPTPTAGPTPTGPIPTIIYPTPLPANGILIY